MDGSINFIGSLSGSIDEGGGGGGSTVTITPTYSSGTKLADYTIGETSGAIFVDFSHVHQVSDANQPSHPLSSPSPPALNLSQHQSLFK